jgi:hypothetical protein
MNTTFYFAFGLEIFYGDKFGKYDNFVKVNYFSFAESMAIARNVVI